MHAQHLRLNLMAWARCSAHAPLSVAVLLGTLGLLWLPQLPPIALLLPGAAGMAWLAWRVPSARAVCWVGLAFVIAVCRAGLVLHDRLPRALERQEFLVTGRVVGLPQSRSDAVRFVLRVEQAWHDGKRFPLHGKLRVSWYGAPQMAHYACRRWHLLLRLRRPRGSLDPGAFDSERQALEQRISAVGYVRAQGDNRSPGIVRWCVDGMRARLASAIGHSVESRTASSLLRALAVGDKRGLRAQDWRIARSTGVSHLLAISGFHVGVAALLGGWLAAGIWWMWPGLGNRVPRRVAQYWCALVPASAYALLAGFGLPTRRALLMITVLVLAGSWRRRVMPAQALSLALLAVLVTDPLAVLAPGFWLSFAAVALLVLMLEPRKAGGWRGHLRTAGQAQLLMSVALLPLTAWFFGQGAPWGWFANAFAIPVISLLVVPLILAGMFVWPLVPSLAQHLWQLSGMTMERLWQALGGVAHWPGALWYLPAVGAAALIFASIGALWLFVPRGLPGRWLGLLLFAPLLWPGLPRLPTGGFRITMLDVGQGLSVLVRTRKHLLLYDAGARYPSGFNYGDAVVLPAIRHGGYQALDRMIISHGDNDHAGGAVAVARAFPRALRLSGEPARMRVPMQTCRAGQHWTWDGVSMRVLSPADRLRPLLGRNDLSCVLLISGPGGRMLLTGDILRDLEGAVADRVGSGPPLVVLVPHHGSNSSSSSRFISDLHPILALVSAGWLNRFGHPRETVLARYRHAGVPVFDTATSGAVRVDFPPHGTPRVIWQWRHEHPRFWRE